MFVSELTPSLDENIDNKINIFNDKLNQWSVVNGIKVIKMNLSFKLGTGEIDQMCYESESEKAGMVLNRYGALRLLSVMDRQCKCLRVKENIEKSDGNTYRNKFSAMNKNKPTVSINKMSQNQFEGQNFERRNARQNHYRRIPEYRQQYQQADSRHFSRTYESSNPRTDEGDKRVVSTAESITTD